MFHGYMPSSNVTTMLTVQTVLTVPKALGAYSLRPISHH
jgi:hypothetical protein